MTKAARPGLAVILAFAAGCVASNGGAPEPWPADQPGPFPSPTPWHRDSGSGLAVRLVAPGPFILGRPIRVVVEAKNFGARPVCVDVQAIDKGNLHLKRMNSVEAAPLDVSPAGGQTWQSFVFLQPGQECELDSLDLTEPFAIFGSGDYSLRFTGLRRWGKEDWGPPSEAPPGSVVSGVPESAPLQLKIGAGTMSYRDRLLQRLLPILPAGWVLRATGHSEDADGAIAVRLEGEYFEETQHHPYVDLLCFPSAADEKGRKLLGRGPWGGVWISDLELSQFNGPHPSDESNRARLREQLMPELRGGIAKALELR